MTGDWERLAVPGVELAYRVTGDGPPLVLVHGSATDADTWDGVVGDLARDRRVVVYDRRGYGRSSAPPVRDHRVHARDLTAVLERVAGAPAEVVGWSSGANVALAVAVRRPGLFRALVAVEPPFHGLRHADRAVLGTLLRLKVTQWRGRRVAAAEVFFRFGSALRSGGNAYDAADEPLRAYLRRHAGPVLAEWDPHPFGVMHEHVPTRAVARLTVPLTLVLGGESSPWMAGLAGRLAARRPGTRTVVVPGASHLVHHDRPDEFVTAVREALSTASG